MLAPANRASLLNAVPSFGPRWEAWCADRAGYVARFPQEALSDAELSDEFLWEMASHLGKRVASGEVHEVGSLFAALEPILTEADAETWHLLTVGFLESLIYAVEREGGDAAPLGALAAGAAAGFAWRAAFEYIHPPDERRSSPPEA